MFFCKIKNGWHDGFIISEDTLMGKYNSIGMMSTGVSKNCLRVQDNYVKYEIIIKKRLRLCITVAVWIM